jgi:hypothetical protein
MEPKSELNPDPMEGRDLEVLQRQWQQIDFSSHRLMSISQTNMGGKF